MFRLFCSSSSRLQPDHRNFDPGICEVVGWTKYGSFLSTGNFRGILLLPIHSRDPPPTPSNPFKIQENMLLLINSKYFSSSVSDTPPQSRSSPKSNHTEHFNGSHSNPIQSRLDWTGLHQCPIHTESNQAGAGHSQFQAVANFSPNLSPKTNKSR